MRVDVLPRLRCPSCLAGGASGEFELDPTRLGGGEDGGATGDLLEGYLVCRRCRDVRLVIGGIAILPRDLPHHLATHGNVYHRTPIGDPRVTRFVYGMAANGVDHVPFDEVVARYGDLIPAAKGGGGPAPQSGSPADALLDDTLRDARAEGPALEVGCGVGRGTFVLAGRTGDAIGVDRSIARLRRARNVQTAEEFLLPTADAEAGEVPIDLSRLEREGADFAVANSSLLPFADGAFRTVVLKRGDGEGPWPDPSAALAEARRVTAAGGTLLLEEPPSRPGDVPAFRVARVSSGAAVPR